VLVRHAHGSQPTPQIDNDGQASPTV